MSEVSMARLSPSPNRGGIYGLGPAQLLAAGGCVTATLIVLGMGHWKAALVIFAISVLLLVPWSDGVAGYQWLPRIFRILNLVVHGGTTHRSRAHLQGFASRGAQMPRAYIKEFNQLEFLEFPFRDGAIGVLHNKSDKSMTVSLTGVGGKFLLLDPSGQASHNIDFGAMLDELAENPSPIKRLQWTHRTVPMDTAAHEEFMGSNMDKTATADSFGAQAYAASVDAAFQGSHHQLEFTLQTAPSLFKQAQFKKGGLLQAFEEVLAPNLVTLVDSLRGMGVQGIRANNTDDYINLLRHSFSPMESEDLNREELQRSHDGSVVDEIEATAWPSHIKEYATRVEINDTQHTSFWIKGYPERPVAPDHLARLLNVSGITRAISIIAEPIDAKMAGALAGISSTVHEARRLSNQEKGKMDRAQNRKVRATTQETDEELSAGYTDWRYSGYVTVSAADKDALDKSVKEIKRVARKSRIYLMPLHGWQLAAVGYTAPMGRGLD